MKKQTAVEWLKEMLIDNKYLSKDAEHLFEESKEMEKEQHFNSYRRGGLIKLNQEALKTASNLFLDDDVLDFEYYFEQYYKYTYGN